MVAHPNFFSIDRQSLLPRDIPRMPSLKSKFEYRFLESPDTKEQLKGVCSGLLSILRAAKDVASNAGIPGLAIGFNGLLFLVDAIQVR
jgi:hypothetical protein